MSSSDPTRAGSQADEAPSPPLAGWPLRVAGALIDGLVLLPFYLVAGVGGGIRQADNIFATLLGGLVMAIGWVGLIGIGVWNHAIKQGSSGRTIGKGVVGITLVRRDSLQPVGAPVAFVRQVLHALDSICMIGFLWPLWDPHRQTFADKMVRSVVIVEAKG